MKSRLRRTFAFSLALALATAVAAQESVAFVSSPAALSANTIAVVYPEADEPFHSIFGRIVDGIADIANGKMRVHAVDAGTNPTDLNALLKRDGTKVVIALGRRGMKAVSGSDRDMPVVVGAVSTFSEAENRMFTGISLSPLPALLFGKLKALQPAIKRIFVIYDPRQNEWLIALAREAARNYGLELVAQEATDLAGAVRLYEAVFSSVDPRTDALWLLHDSTTVDENTVLPLVLQASWERVAIVFSGNLLHARRGVLFALYPNDRELGRSLAHVALGIVAGDSRTGIVPLRDVATAVNLRTANHIGLHFTHRQLRTFDAIFP